MKDISIFLLMLSIFFLGLALMYYFDAESMSKKYNHLKQLTVKDYWLVRERIKLMQPDEFEEFCANIWRHIDGCKAYRTKATGDMGRDVVLNYKGGTIFIEAKHWSPLDPEHGTKVGRPISMKLAGSMVYGLDGIHPVKRGRIMTTAEFTDECIKYSDAVGIECWGLNDIMGLVEEIGTEEVYEDVGIRYDGRYIYED